MRKYIPVMLIWLSLNSVSFAQEQYNLPYGNFGLDYLSNEISDGQSYLEENTGVGIFFDYYAVLLSNPYGGAGQGTCYTHEMIYGANLDLGKILGWKGAQFTISGAYNAGSNLSGKIGNFFTVSESYVTGGAMFYELYLGQTLETRLGNIEVRMGRISMADNFMDLPIYDYLVSGGMDDVPSAIYSNSPFTSSPTASWGATVQFTPESMQDVAFSAGIFQAPLNIDSPDWDGTDFSISENDGYMMMFQAQWSPEFGSKMENGSPVSGTGLQGVYQIGGWFYGGYPMQQFNSLNYRNNAYGFYIQGQQMLWRNDSNLSQYVSVWLGGQMAPVESVAAMPFMAYAGLQFQGFVPNRPNDGFYAAWMTGWFNSSYGDSADTPYDASYETVIELTYVFQINNNISIQPDVQYVMRPNGNSDIDDALVIGGQLIVSF